MPTQDPKAVQWSSTAGISMTDDVHYTDVLSFDEYQGLQPIAEVVATEDKGERRPGTKTRNQTGESSEVFVSEFVLTFEHAALDTACRKSLIGEYTLAGLQQCLKGKGFKVPG